VGPECVDCGRRNLLRCDVRLVGGNRTIHQNDDESSFFLTNLVGDHVCGNVFGPDRLVRARSRELYRREGTNRRLGAVVEHREIRFGQPTDWLALAVQHHDVELHQVDAGAELHAIGLLLREHDGRRHDVHAQDTDAPQTHD
jgi:hypothetical protein